MRDGVILFAHVIALLLLNNVLRSTIIVKEMNNCGEEFSVDALGNSSHLLSLISELEEPFGIIMLNSYALPITLNWLCNTANMENVHQRTLFFTLDKGAQSGLLSHYPHLKVFTWNAPCVQETFKPADATYMSFFLLRTNLIRALLRLKRSFWMLQADTFWKDDLYSANDWANIQADVVLDQQGFEESSESRKRQMNGANFLVVSSNRTASLIEKLHWYQSHFHVTDPDAIKIMCNKKGEYQCLFIDHSIVSGWEWIYGSQSKAPLLIQLDGETEGGKVETLMQYNMWFLRKDLTCDSQKVDYASRLVESGKVPRLFSSSKLKQKFLLAIGQFLGDLPLFGRFYRIYGGLTSLYLQFF